MKIGLFYRKEIRKFRLFILKSNDFHKHKHKEIIRENSTSDEK